jgi:amino acid transporter
VSRQRVPTYSVFAIGLFSGILMIPAVWNYLVGYFVGTAISVIGLYIAFMIPCYLRWRLGDSWQEQRSWSLGRHYKWLTPVGIVWVALITVLFSAPLYKTGVPWEDGFTWELTNYTLLWFAGIGLIFGGWWFLSAKNWFKGPVRMGTDEELERMEEEELKRFTLPTESASAWLVPARPRGRLRAPPFRRGSRSRLLPCPRSSPARPFLRARP